MAITITKVKKDWVKVELNPSIQGSKRLFINHEINVARVTLKDDPAINDIIKIFMVDRDVLELHYSQNVTVGGTLATDNAHLMDLIEDLFTSV